MGTGNGAQRRRCCSWHDCCCSSLLVCVDEEATKTNFRSAFHREKKEEERNKEERVAGIGGTTKFRERIDYTRSVSKLGIVGIPMCKGRERHRCLRNETLHRHSRHVAGRGNRSPLPTKRGIWPVSKRRPRILLLTPLFWQLFWIIVPPQYSLWSSRNKL